MKDEYSIAILCGGKSSRFSGDKTRALYEDVPLYLHIWDKLSEMSEDIFLQVSGSGDHKKRHFPDLIQGAGPLGAIYSALHWARREWVFIVACDLVQFDPNLVETLSAKLDSAGHVVVPRWKNGFLEPLAAFYHVQATFRISQMLESDNFRISDLYSEIPGPVTVEVDNLIESRTISANCFRNINSPEDLEAIKSEADTEQGAEP